MMDTAASRFWAQVSQNPEGCWIWKGRKLTDGYGGIWWGRRQCRAHRIAWELTYGPIPASLLICHVCDHPLCVRPAHLWLGTPADNSGDMTKRRRQAVANHWKARLTAPDIETIRTCWFGGMTHRQLGPEFGVSHQQIGHILAERCWRPGTY